MGYGQRSVTATVEREDFCAWVTEEKECISSREESVEEEVEREGLFFYCYFWIVKFINRVRFRGGMRNLSTISAFTYMASSIATVVLSLTACEEKTIECSVDTSVPTSCCDKYQVDFNRDAPKGFVYLACRDAFSGREGTTYVYERAIDDNSPEAWERVYLLDSEGWIIEDHGKLTNWSAGHPTQK